MPVDADTTEFVVVASRIFCFLMLEGVIQIPCPSSSSEIARLSNESSRVCWESRDADIGVARSNCSSSDWTLQSSVALVRMDTTDSVASMEGG